MSLYSASARAAWQLTSTLPLHGNIVLVHISFVNICGFHSLSFLPCTAASATFSVTVSPSPLPSVVRSAELCTSFTTVMTDCHCHDCDCDVCHTCSCSVKLNPFASCSYDSCGDCWCSPVCKCCYNSQCREPCNCKVHLLHKTELGELNRLEFGYLNNCIREKDWRCRPPSWAHFACVPCLWQPVLFVQV